MSKETMKQALEALEELNRTGDTQVFDLCYAPKVIPALRLAIEQAERQEPVAWMTIDAYGEEDDIHYENPEGHLPDGWTYLPLYTHPLKAKQPQEEPLGYWNAVQGWVELPEEANKPTAWVYPEALEAFQQGKPWTAYGADGSGPNSDGIERIPLYTTPPQRQPEQDWETRAEIAEQQVVSLAEERDHYKALWKAARQKQEPVADFADAIVAEARGRYTLPTSRAAFEAGAIFARQLITAPPPAVRESRDVLANRPETSSSPDAQIAAHAKRLALELECLLLDANHPAVSRWWDSAHEALDQYRADIDRLYPQEHVSPLGKD